MFVSLSPLLLFSFGKAGHCVTVDVAGVILLANLFPTESSDFSFRVMVRGFFETILDHG